MAVARSSCGGYSWPIATPASTVVIASTMSSQPNTRAAVRVGVGERHRADLVDHRRRVAGGDARELVALLRRVELLLVRDLRDVEVEDVAPVLPRGRAEEDVAAHAARAGERGVERLERHVAGPDEVDLLLARLRRAQPQRDGAGLARDDVERVQERVEPVRHELLLERRLVDAVHDHQQLVERERAAAAHAGDHELVDDALDAAEDRRDRAPRAARRAARTAGRASGATRSRGRRRASARRSGRRTGGRRSPSGPGTGRTRS